MSQAPQVENDFQKFIELSPVTYKTRDGGIAEALALISERGEQRIEKSGVSSASAFQIAAAELVKAGELVSIPILEEPQAKQFTLTVEEYRSIPTSLIIRQYQTQPEFKAAVDALILAGKI